MINLSDTTPAPINGGLPVSWQLDASGNVSGYVANVKVQASPTAGVVTMNAATGNSFWITVNAAITSMVINNPSDGQEITLVWAQDATGHAVTLGAGFVLGSFTISTGANQVTTARFTYNAADTNWYIIGQNGL